jgi:hypothetical protein
MLSLLRLVAGVGLGGGLGGHFLGMAIEHEPVDAGERGELRLRRGVGTRSLGDSRTTKHSGPRIGGCAVALDHRLCSNGNRYDPCEL